MCRIRVLFTRKGDSMNMIVRSSSLVVIVGCNYALGINPHAARIQAAVVALRAVQQANPYAVHKSQAQARALAIAGIAQANRAAIQIARKMTPASRPNSGVTIRAPAQKNIYDARVDWQAAFRAQLRKPLTDLLYDMHRHAAKYKDNLDMAALVNTIATGKKIDINAALQDVNFQCAQSKIVCVDNTTQDISTFVLWIMCRLTTSDCYKAINRQAILQALAVLKQYNPNIDHRNPDTLETFAKCCGRIHDQSLKVQIMRLFRH